MTLCGWTIHDNWDLVWLLLAALTAAVMIGVGADELWHYWHRRH